MIDINSTEDQIKLESEIAAQLNENYYWKHYGYCTSISDTVFIINQCEQHNTRFIEQLKYCRSTAISLSRLLINSKLAVDIALIESFTRSAAKLDVTQRNLIKNKLKKRILDETKQTICTEFGWSPTKRDLFLTRFLTDTQLKPRLLLILEDSFKSYESIRDVPSALEPIFVSWCVANRQYDAIEKYFNGHIDRVSTKRIAKQLITELKMHDSNIQ